MLKWSRCLLLVVPLGFFPMLGCAGGVGVSPTSPSAPAASYQVVTISDLHFNPLYDPSLFPQLVAAAPSQWDAIYRTSTISAPSIGGTDTNYPLLAYALASVYQTMQQNQSNSPVVLFTGDLLGHNIPANYCAAQYSPNPPPPDCVTNESSAIQTFINNTFTFVAGKMRTAVGTAPVIYVPGNIDTYSGGYGPSTSFLVANGATVYSEFLNGVGDNATFTSNFETGGYYSVAPLGSNLLVVGLNSNSFVYGWPSYGSADTEIAWLDAQLQAAQNAGQKVWILMHVPPGANAQEIVLAAPVPKDVNASLFANEAEDMWQWDPGVQKSFMDTLNRYPGVVTLMLAGHTHMDEFRMLAPGYVVEQLPSISPCFGNNPAYKVLTVTQDTFTPTDYQSFDFNLASQMPLPFLPLYDFSSTYGATQGPLANSLAQLYPQLDSNPSTLDMYRFFYTSGGQGVNPSTQSPWNPINDLNWPIFGCTIGEADEPGYISCVNTSEPSTTDSAPAHH
ncbi:MAG TPA: metallophosphoesterase [Verrucomicrobiae bacterium]|nr:metallophosphoesterase [Verrucomicrobiae bacterium]